MHFGQSNTSRCTPSTFYGSCHARHFSFSLPLPFVRPSVYLHVDNGKGPPASSLPACCSYDGKGRDACQRSKREINQLDILVNRNVTGELFLLTAAVRMPARVLPTYMRRCRVIHEIGATKLLIEIAEPRAGHKRFTLHRSRSYPSG